MPETDTEAAVTRVAATMTQMRSLPASTPIALSLIHICLVTISVAASFAALALTVIFSRALTRRITRLAEAIRVVRGGDYAHRLKPEGNDELTELCEEFNNMTQTLETTEQQRRRFVSDASHELKTPLAAIRLLADSIEQNEGMDCLLYTSRCV